MYCVCKVEVYTRPIGERRRSMREKVRKGLRVVTEIKEDVRTRISICGSRSLGPTVGTKSRLNSFVKDLFTTREEFYYRMRSTILFQKDV